MEKKEKDTFVVFTVKLKFKMYSCDSWHSLLLFDLMFENMTRRFYFKIAGSYMPFRFYQKNIRPPCILNV